MTEIFITFPTSLAIMEEKKENSKMKIQKSEEKKES